MSFIEKSFTGKNQWYLYICSLLIIFIATQIGSIPFSLVKIWENKDVVLSSGGQMDNLQLNLSISSLSDLALVLLSFVVGFFAIFFVVKYVHNKKYTDIVTGRNKIDYGRILFAIAVWGGISLVVVFLPLCFSLNASLVYQFDIEKFIPLLIISLLLFPFQIGFEELLFRGYLMQWSIVLFKSPWVALVLTSILFGVMHMNNPEVAKFGTTLMLPQYIIMGFILGYLAVKDNGLELSIGMHLVNNVFLALIISADYAVFQTDSIFRLENAIISWIDTLVLVLGGAIFIAICAYKYKFLSNRDNNFS